MELTHFKLKHYVNLHLLPCFLVIKCIAVILCTKYNSELDYVTFINPICTHTWKSIHKFLNCFSDGDMNIKMVLMGCMKYFVPITPCKFHNISIWILHLNTQYPYIGASPDGFFTCECCGMGILEVKSPHCT